MSQKENNGVKKQQEHNIEKHFDKIFKDYYSLCYYCANNIVSNCEDAEDAVIAGFEALWNNRADFDAQKCSLKTYLLMLVRRKAIDLLRKKKSEVPLDEDLKEVFYSDERDRVELRQMLTDAINRLNAQEKELFYRRYFYFESYGKIAAQMGKSVDSVKSSLYRIRKAIQANLAEGGLD